MAKKDLFSQAPKSRLAQMAQGPKPTTEESLGLKSPQSPQRKPKSFRLYERDLFRLAATVENLSRHLGKRVTDADLLRGLLCLGEKMPEEELLAAIRQARSEIL